MLVVRLAVSHTIITSEPHTCASSMVPLAAYRSVSKLWTSAWIGLPVLVAAASVITALVVQTTVIRQELLNSPAGTLGKQRVRELLGMDTERDGSLTQCCLDCVRLVGYAVLFGAVVLSSRDLTQGPLSMEGWKILLEAESSSNKRRREDVGQAGTSVPGEDWTLLEVTKPSPSKSKAVLSAATTCPPTSSTLLGTGNEDEHDNDPARRCSASNIVRRLIMTKGEEPPSALRNEAEISRGTPSSHPSDQSGSSLARMIDPELAKVLAEGGFTSGRHITDLPAEVAELFCVPERDAAHYLGKSLTALKKLCRQHNLMRWPYRKARISRANIIFAQTHALCVCVVCEGTPHHTSAFNAHGMAHFLCAAQGGCQDKLGHKHPSEGARSCAAVSTLHACLRACHTRAYALAHCVRMCARCQHSHQQAQHQHPSMPGRKIEFCWYEV